MPSPLVVCSRMMTWPLFSPPTPAPETSIASSDVLVADGRAHDTRRPPRSTASASPPLESTLTTRVDSARAPRASRSRAMMPSSWSPSTTCPVSSTATQRSASPSSAKPTSLPSSATIAARAAGAVAPQPRLMLHAVRLVEVDADRGARGGEDLRRDHAAGAVGAVEATRAGRSADASAPAPCDAARYRSRPARASTLAADAVVASGWSARPRARAAPRARPPSCVVELEAALVEHLEAVVVGGVVGGGDHDPRAIAQVTP